MAYLSRLLAAVILGSHGLLVLAKPAERGAAASTLSSSGVLLFVGITICCGIGYFIRHFRRQPQHAEREPLLPVPDPRLSRPADGVAAIGTPARDFVRLSSLPASVFRSEEDRRRCLACGETGKCVALRPCGHAVLCRECSDFVYTCPHCGQYISGVALPGEPPSRLHGVGSPVP